MDMDWTQLTKRLGADDDWRIRGAPQLGRSHSDASATKHQGAKISAGSIASRPATSCHTGEVKPPTNNYSHEIPYTRTDLNLIAVDIQPHTPRPTDKMPQEVSDIKKVRLRFGKHQFLTERGIANGSPTVHRDLPAEGCFLYVF